MIINGTYAYTSYDVRRSRGRACVLKTRACKRRVTSMVSNSQAEGRNQRTNSDRNILVAAAVISPDDVGICGTATLWARRGFRSHASHPCPWREISDKRAPHVNEKSGYEAQAVCSNPSGGGEIRCCTNSSASIGRRTRTIDGELLSSSRAAAVEEWARSVWRPAVFPLACDRSSSWKAAAIAGCASRDAEGAFRCRWSPSHGAAVGSEERVIALTAPTAR